MVYTKSHARYPSFSNPRICTKYLDRNHAGILIIWDRMFGTFVEEGETPTYGLTRNIDTYNPFKIAFSEWRDIFNDLRKSRNLNQFFGYLFGPPGWSHDGSRQTTAKLRAAANLRSQIPDLG